MRLRRVPPEDRRWTRRGLLTGGAATAAAGALSACSSGRSPAEHASERTERRRQAVITAGSVTEPFHGPHQAGIATRPQAQAVFVGLDLLAGLGRGAIADMMRQLTDHARRLTQGRPVADDPEPELAALPSRLTITFGFGPGLFRAAGLVDRRPAALPDLPAFTVDRLEDRWSHGDLLVQLCADDGLTLAHAMRVIVREARRYTRVRWVQRGFRRSPGIQSPTATQRNLLGQLDGTANPAAGTLEFDRSVWAREGPSWFHGGTTMVFRRIRMDLELWDRADQAVREAAVGRRLADGSPLTGRTELDEPDLKAMDIKGLPIIADNAHIRLARSAGPFVQMLRRGYSYDEGLTPEGTSDSGLLFASFQADINRQFLPVQLNLDGADLMNRFTAPIGSAVFAIPPGCDRTGWIGRTLLS